MRLFLLSLTIFLLHPPDIALAGSRFGNVEPVFSASFDETIGIDKPAGLPLERKGGRLIPDGVSGNALRLNKNEYIAVDASPIISSKEGTLMLWVRPHWSTGEGSSHTFVSFGWKNSGAYFVLSDGWWEPSGGRPYTYFIFNNQDSARAERINSYTIGSWMQIVCTWKVNRTEPVRLYKNGLLFETGYKHAEISDVPVGKLYFGSDKGTPLTNDRWGDCDLDEIVIFNRALSDEEILAAYNRLNPAKRERLYSTHDIIAQTRAIFDEGTGWMTKSGADETIRRIKKAGFNVYVPCVWHGKGTRYPSQIAVSEAHIDNAYDPLDYLIKVAHENGIEVHAWFTVALRMPNFLNGYHDFGLPEDAFNLHRPEFRKFIVSVILDVARRYEIDGINLDYIRTMGICTSDYCRDQYNKLYHRELNNDVSAKTPNGELGPYLQNWMNEAVESVVREISQDVKKIKPNVIISVDDRPMPNDMPPSREGRRGVKWANDGLVDVIFNMDYSRNPDFETQQAVRKKLKNPSALIALLGNYETKSSGNIVPRDDTMLIMLIEYARRLNSAGVGVYWYSSLSDDQVNALSKGVFKDRTTPNWGKSTDTGAHPH
jgi:hypothetical protein